MSMTSAASMYDSDRYYTPEGIARFMVEASTLVQCGQRFLDPTCGRGSLLAAVSRMHSNRAACAGLDADAEVVRFLRREYPHWKISRGNILCDSSIRGTEVYRNRGYDTIVGNPPFSQNGRKGVKVKYKGEIVNCSIAMACTLKSIGHFQPRLGVVSVVPESFIYSQVDEDARNLLAKEFKLSVLKGLCSRTFTGARVRSMIVEMERGSGEVLNLPNPIAASSLAFEVVRGALPVHLAQASQSRCTGAVRFIHSTGLVGLNVSNTLSWYTVGRAKGRIRGRAILIPRVGSPSLSRVAMADLDQEVQLSDCVIAIQAAKPETLRIVYQSIHEEWREFSSLFTGTGARYVTVERLERWIAGVVGPV